MHLSTLAGNETIPYSGVMVDWQLLQDVLLLLRSRSSGLNWPTLMEVINRYTDTQTLDWWLPIAACRCFGQSDVRAIPASAAVVSAQAAIILVDDILDEDPKGLHQTLGVGRSANLAMALESLSFEVLGTASVPPATLLEAQQGLARMFVVTALGQDQDVGSITNEAEYWQAVTNKSTPFYGLALQLGGQTAEAPPKACKHLYDLGVLVGEIVQLHDDLFDALDPTVKPDWSPDTSNLLILYSLTVDHEDRHEFSSSLRTAAQPEVLKRLQSILVSSGAVSYCLYQLTIRHKKCRELASLANLPNHSPLNDLLEYQIAPARSILEQVGMDLPEELELHE